MIERREQKIIDFIQSSGGGSSKEIFENVDLSVSYATLKRILSSLKSANYLITKGKGKGTKYLLSPAFELIQPIDLEAYYNKEIDERQIKESFNFELITSVLSQYNTFNEQELNDLSVVQSEYQAKIAQLSENEYKKELERLAIDLSWKSSQIEGNTYSLLETEHLLKEKETAAGKTREEATMLLNHKEALDFIIEHHDYLHPLKVAKIEDIHSILTKELQVERNLRTPLE